jgi:MoaA/NifB/PqqE/SkfB family radical SAM enzyme
VRYGRATQRDDGRTAPSPSSAAPARPWGPEGGGLSRLGDARWLKRAFLPGGLPIQLTFFVTSRCNAKCSHCFYGEQLNQPMERELTLEQVERMAKTLPSSMIWVAFGGGEPFLRKDLAEVAGVFFRHNRPRMLTVVTNGINPSRIEAVTRDILARRGDSFVNVAVSLDGLEETHDRERGVPGNFRQAVETLRRLRALRDTEKGFGFSTLTTVHRNNASDLGPLEEFIDREVRPDNRGLNLVRGTPLDPATLEVGLRPYREAVARKRADVAARRLPLQSFPLSRLNGAKERVLYAEVERVARTGVYRSPCRAGRVGAVLYENGDVAACEILDKKVGNLRDFDMDFGRLWASPAAEALRAEIAERRCRCTWECAVNTNVLFGPRYWPELAREWVSGGAGGKREAARAAVPESVTVLVPCRDEAAVIVRKVRNSLRLRFPDPARAEVLVVDDGSTDGSAALVEAEIARRGEAGPAVRCLPNAHAPGKAGAIRTGFEAARGEIVLLTDADALLEREGLPRAMACFEDPRTGVVCGEQVYCDRLPASDEAPGDAWNTRGGALMDAPGRREGLYDRAMRAVRKLESRLDSTFAVHGQMALFRRSVGFEPRAGVAADDVDLSLQARRKGYRIRYAEGARFWEERTTTLRAELQQKKRRGSALAQALWVNRDMLARPRYGAFGTLSLPFQWAFLVAQPFAVAAALTAGLAVVAASAPLAAAAAAGGVALAAAASKGARSYLFMNGVMVSAILSLLAGRSVTDRWPRDRDAGHGGAQA